MSLLVHIDAEGSKKKNVTLTQDQWTFLLCGIRDLKRHLEEVKRQMETLEQIRDFEELIRENDELLELIEPQLVDAPLTCKLDDLTDFAKVGSVVNIDGALWEVV